MTNRVLMVCFEAMEPTLLEAWGQQGLLPILWRFINQSTTNRFNFDGSTENIATWASMATGATLGDHGIWELNSWDADRYGYRINQFDEVYRIDPFWVRLGELGKRSFIVDWPRAPLRGHRHAVQILNWMAHFNTGVCRASDPDLYQQLQSIYSAPGRMRDLEAVLRANSSPDNALDWLNHRTRLKTQFVSQRIARDDWDFFAVNFSETHDIGHRFWDIHDPTHPQHDPKLRAAIGDPLEIQYRRMDAVFGELLAQVGPETIVMFYTSTGMQANYSGNGLLDYFLSRMNNHQFESFFDRPCFEIRNHHASGAVRFNLKGRESRGIIEEKDFDPFADNLTGHLLELTDTETGRPVVKDVVKVREVFPGRRLNDLPDLFVVWERDAPIRGFDSPAYGRMDFGDFRSLWTGDHSTNASMYIRNALIDSPDSPPIRISNFEDFPKLIGSLLGADLARYKAA